LKRKEIIVVVLAGVCCRSLRVLKIKNLETIRKYGFKVIESNIIKVASNDI